LAGVLSATPLSAERDLMITFAAVMACSPNDYMRLLGLVESSVAMHFYFTDGTYVRGFVARADLDPITRSGMLLLVSREHNRVFQCNAGDLLKISSRAPDGSLH
jgi:hypothetical protein